MNERDRDHSYDNDLKKLKKQKIHALTKNVSRASLGLEESKLKESKSK